MDFETIKRVLHDQMYSIRYWNANPALIVVGYDVHHAIASSRECMPYVGPQGLTRLFGIPYTVGANVAPDYLKVLCETPTAPSLASDCTAPSRRYDRANSPRIGEPPQPSH